ncbi:accessory Sec system protein translocase subunit SecY2 [Streptococcus suis]|uniref:accessory Sec system protein translocase subunit SecY2 n=1 Tax=Streptococcus suis TaxID=1307 RepID=UPI00209AF6D0|nr:accessory Sec system protein translocase subunit SecY2 [Streptococcus suis]MCO8174796.1 accessory Sec system protein translocase subunit SecY2 [Streptococcus suis]MCO8209227.1 accessory Sec system protein translocase subunit SecY2 [Streptococcus suis]MCO8233353.1 accessory Sec system protein translocase subunit SecY2 [Streptococcus suis]HEM3489161.1 accessory Sec system protein translocase subunit SecY2 [Streptococcus suis]HEM3506280.1 accessory Sec system protein translocase subunit SecY2 
MLAQLVRKIQGSLVLKKIIWAIGIVLVYMLGKYTPLGTLPLHPGVVHSYNLTNSLDALAMVSGGNFSTYNLFSLGLAPWMTSMILWRFLSLFDLVKTGTRKQLHVSQMFLLLLIAFIQSLGLTYTSDFYNVSFLGMNSEWLPRLTSIVVMVAGSFVLMWLANLNVRKGIGGASVIIISNMTLAFLTNVVQLIKSSRFSIVEWMLVLLLIGLGSSLLIALTIKVYRAEYRIPIRRIMIVSSLAEETYIPIKITPAGGMPFMYAMTLMVLPTLVFSALGTFFPKQEWIHDLSLQFGLSDLPGILFYIFLLFILAIGFAYFNLDSGEIAEEMQKNGDFIEGVRPGLATKKYIESYIWRLAVIGAIYTCLIGGIPMVLVWKQSGQVGIALLVNNIYIITTLMLGVIEQIDVMLTWKRYGDLI